MTWYFRTIEPRQGRVFAELKIKHLVTFPLPTAIQQTETCKALNELGEGRASLTDQLVKATTPQGQLLLQRAIQEVDAKVQKAIERTFELPAEIARITGLKEMQHAKCSDASNGKMSNS